MLFILVRFSKKDVMNKVLQRLNQSVYVFAINFVILN